MPLAAGEKLGPYEIIAPIGKGGMGEVYRAHDPRTGRDVAVKVSTAQFSERFDREIRAVAALNHPNICTLFDVGSNYLVMEIIEGPTLAERLRQGPLPLTEALAIARQIADALEAAHEKGIVHRDLKPGNLKIKPDGSVKVLDFGLATAAAAPAAALRDDSPTFAMSMTDAGIILGTASYMAPEQARGKAVDKRADIWAFGVVLYEMLAGQKMFAGETVADTLAQVMEREPSWDRIPSRIQPLLRRCLARDPKGRLRDIGDAMALLEADTPAQSAKRSTAWLAWAAAGALALALAALAFVHFREAPQPPVSVRFEVPPPEDASFQSFSLSPDGRTLVFLANGKLWIRPLDSLQLQMLPGTEGAAFPFWSPDSAFVGFFADGKLKRIGLADRVAVIVCDAADSRGGSWSSAGKILFTPSQAQPMHMVSDVGGIAAPVLQPLASGSHRFPEFLPGGERFLYTVVNSKPETEGIYVGSLDGAAPIRLLPDVTSAAYVPSALPGRNGYLVFRHGTTLMAASFDLDRMQVGSEMLPLAERVGGGGGGSGSSAFSVSPTGGLVYGPGDSGVNQVLLWMNRDGTRGTTVGPPGGYNDFRLSPDEQRILMDRPDLQTSRPDIWLLDTQRGVPSRVTFDPAVDNIPIWSPDGLQVLFPSNRNGSFDLYIKPASGGSEQLFLKLGTSTGWATDWTRDGRFVMYQIPGPKTGQDLWILPQSKDAKPYPYLQTQFREQDGQFSPDGHWVAYSSNESGRDEIFVQPFPRSGAQFQISSGGGSEAHWNAAGTEIYYVSSDRNLTAIPVKANAEAGTIQVGAAKVLFPVPSAAFRRSYAPARDGQRFLVLAGVAGRAGSPLTVVTNWQAGLKK